MALVNLILALLVILIWGIWGVVLKFGIAALGPYTYIIGSQITSLLVVLALLGVLRWQGVKMSYPAGRDLIYPIMGGVLIVSGLILLYQLISSAPTSLAIPLTALYPAVTVLILVFILGVEVLTPVKLVGVGLAVVAAVLLAL